MPSVARSMFFRTLLLAVALLARPAITFAVSVGEQPDTADATVIGTEDTCREVHLDLVTEPMPRNASLAVAGTESASRALELAARPLLGGVLARRDCWGVASRAAWVLWIDLPLGSLCGTLNHEYGHLARAPDDVARSQVDLSVSGPFLTIEGRAAFELPRHPTAAEQLAFQSGGWEADRLSLLRTRDMLYSGERTYYVDALDYTMSKLHTTLYLVLGTRESLLNPQTEEDWHWDPLLYARWLSEIEDGPDYSTAAFRERARRLRRGAYWNLADFTFWTATIDWIKGYVVDGEHSRPAPWLRLGRIGLAPSLCFTLTPVGPERTVLTGLRFGRRSGDVHLRWTDPVGGDRIVGGGAVWGVGRSGTLVRSITADAWRNPSASLGGRVEVGGEWRHSPDSHTGLRWSLGFKSRGYLTGLSDAPGVYASAGLRALF
jgi:hypothetical protein